MPNAFTTVDSPDRASRTGPSIADPVGLQASGAVFGPGRVVSLRRLLATMVVLLAPGCGGGGDEGANRPANVVSPADNEGANRPANAVSPVADGASAQPGVPPTTGAALPNAPNLPPLPKTEEVKRKEAADAALFGLAASRSRLIIDPAASGRGRVVVSLGAPSTDDDAGYSSLFRNGILARELVRQAMLIAARDELGLATRDEVLGDVVPASSGGSSIQLGSFTTDDRGPNKANHAFVLRGDGGRAERLLKVDLPCPYSPDGDLKKLVERAELLSRRDFPGVLARLGVKGKPNAIKADAKLPAGVEEQPSQLGLTWVLAAVRSLHEAIRADGESPARLGALARTYALLGVLSEFQWHPAHKAFKARALLYAERLVARDPKGDWPLWNRAYVRAMVGMHGDALADLRAAARAGKPSSQPAWADPIEGLAQQDETKVGPGHGVSPKLAALLRMLVLEFPYGTQPSLEAAREVVDLDPECFRACDAMCQASGVSNLHVATTLGPEAFGQTITKSLKSMPGLPASVRDFLARPVGGDAALYRLLETSGAPADDPGEPSWSVMGHLLRETRFVHVFRRLQFMRTVWGVPTDEYWSESRASVAGHRFYPALEILADNSADRFRQRTQFLDQLRKLELEPVEAPMISFLHQSRNKEAMKARYTAELHADHIARDLSQLVEGERDTMKLMFARTLLQVSPDNALALSTMIELDKDSGAKMAEWEKKAGDSQPLLAALAAHSTREKKYDQTERYLTRYIQIHPDFWGYYTLAANYRAKGDLNRWQAMLEKSLTVEDRGLQHARAQGELAYYFMDQGQWAKAKPYAEAAGETWANWGMDCAMRCADGMKDWDRAVLWAQRRSERYPNGPDTLFVWYLMSMRTGRGDLAAARRFTDEYLRTHGGPSGLDPAIRCYYQWLNGDLKGALRSRLESYRRTPNMGDCQIVLALAELVGDGATTDEYRKLLVTQYRNNGPKNARIGELLPGTLKGGKSRPPDMKAVDEVLATIPAERRPAAEFWVGLYLKAHGQSTAARPYLEHAASSRAHSEWHRAIAAQALRARR